MTPYEISLMLHFYAIREPWKETHNDLYHETVEAFLHARLIQKDEASDIYVTTTKGSAFVSQLMKVEIPVAAWVDPDTGEFIDRAIEQVFDKELAKG